MTYELRPYQQRAVEVTYQFLGDCPDQNPCVVLPTGSGKTLVLAQFCADIAGRWGGRVFIVTHVKELLEQAAEKLAAMCPDIEVGVFSAGLRRRDTEQRVIVAGIQSVYKKAEQLGPADVIVVDEAHLIPPSGEGMYRQFIADARAINPAVRIIGLTATPFRMSTGPICTPDGILNQVVFEVGVLELIRAGYLSPLVSRIGAAEANLLGVSKRAGEYVAKQAEARMLESADRAVAELVRLTAARSSVIVFAAGVEHGQAVAEQLRAAGQRVFEIYGTTPASQRAAAVRQFSAGTVKYLVNVGVLTTGFDAPRVDAVALMRPTLSAGLYSQMVGRGLRLSPDTGKLDCVVLDFAGNIERHGPVDKVEIRKRKKKDGPTEGVYKMCPECRLVIAGGFRSCPECGHEFPEPERETQLNETASGAGVLSDQIKVVEYEVSEVWYAEWKKRGAADDAPKTLRVDYVNDGITVASEWICIEHTGRIRRKAARWWSERSQIKQPDNALEAAELGRLGYLAEPTLIWVREVPGQRFHDIVKYKLGAIPDPIHEVPF